MSFAEFPVRLGSNNSREGRAEVFYGGLWGTIAATKWDLTDALVFCRQLGFREVQGTYTQLSTVSKRVFWFGDFDCKGSEVKLGRCKHRLIARALNRYEEPSDVFVRCGEDISECFH